MELRVSREMHRVSPKLTAKRDLIENEHVEAVQTKARLEK